MLPPVLKDPLAAALPVADALPALLDSLLQRPNAVLVAPPGAGKTTLVPLALLDAPWLAGRRLVMLEPRRLAARAAAQRMASLLGEEAGGLVGFRTRIDSAISARTRIEVVTEGILLRRLLSDPLLDGIGAVVLDEVHERSLDADIVLGFCLDLQRQLRPELRLLAMSATADAASLSARLDGPVIESAGRMFPVALRHASRDIAALRDLPDGMARLIRTAMDAEAEGDVLAFLPGVGEIRRTEQILRDHGVAAELLPLHGELPPAEQDRVLRPAPAAARRRHVVLATSIAETSLTVPGVRIVVDGGWRRVPRLDPGSGLSRLETVRISRAAATQRAGRAGREAPGTAWRLWTEQTGRALPLQDRPEILDAELSGFRLQAAAWRAQMDTPADALPLPDPPPRGAFEAAGSLLRALGALDEPGLITPDGARMAALGAHPRLAAMMLAAANPAEAALAADLAALLEERDPLRVRAAQGGRAPDPPSDLALRLELLAGRAPHGTEADRGALNRIRQAAAGYRQRLRTTAPPHGDLAALVAAGFPDRVAQARGEVGAFRLSGGGGAKLPRGDRLADRALLAVAALHVRDAARITLAVPLDPERLPGALLARTVEQVESTLDPSSGAVISRRRRRLGQLVLFDRMLPADPAETARLLARAAGERFESLLSWSDAARQLQARVALLRALDGDSGTLPDLSDPVLRATVVDWLPPALSGLSRVSELAELDLAPLLRRRLEPADRERLDRLLPVQVALRDRSAPVDYTGPVPTVSSRAQDFFGLDRLPPLAEGRVRLQAALLSPAGRPAAITTDLADFWRGGWSDARRDLRGRYPRHDWPEDPSSASFAQQRGTVVTPRRPAR